MTAAWARVLGDGVEPELVARVVGCLAGGSWPELVAAAVVARARAGDVEVSGVLGDVERALASRSRLPVGERGADDLARALVDQGARVLLAGRPGYPERLGWAWPELGAPAWLLWRGAPPPPGPAVAVVGTRRATHDGRTTARALGRFLGARGITVVSGMARGIDQAAHLGALDAGGPTVAVLGTGFGVDYPHGDGALREAVAAAGGLATEHRPGTPPRPHQFLTRNRVVAALADAVVVVEGQARSGALHTARLAAEAGRDVFACPGSLNAPASRGPLDLVRDGAQLLTDFAALLDALPVPARAAPAPATARPAAGPPQTSPLLAPPDTGPLAVVARLLGPVPASAGVLAAAADLPLPRALAVLQALVAAGRARHTARGYTSVAPTPSD